MMNHRRALIILKNRLGEKDLAIANTYIYIGNVYNIISLYDSALIFYQKAIDIQKEILEEVNANLSCTYNNIGSIYREKEDIDQAIEYFLKSLAIDKKLFGEKHPYVSTSYSNIGGVYYRKGAFDLALEYYFKSLAIDIALFGEKHHSVAKNYYNISLIYHEKKDFTLALDYGQKALNIRKYVLHKDHPDIAESYDNLGMIYTQTGYYKLASEYFKKAIQVGKKTWGERGYLITFPYENLGIAYLKAKDYTKALNSLQIALAIEKQYYKKDSYLAEIYNNVGDIYQEQGRFQQALQCYQKGITANIIDFEDTSFYVHPRLQNYLSGHFLLISLQSKALTLEKLYLKQSNQSDLLTALKTYQLCDSLIDQMRQSYTNHHDKLALGETAMKVYEGAVRVSLAMYQTTQDEQYLPLAFYFTEKSKAGTLTAALTDLNAKSFGEIPDSLLALERELKVDQAYYRSQLQEEKSKKNGYDTAKVNAYESRIFTLNRRYDSLIAVLEQQFPRYYQLKYQHQVLPLTELQQKLDAHTTLLEYFVGDSSIYTFTITSRHCSVHQFPKDSSLLQNLKGLQEALNPDMVVKNPQQAYEAFLREAYPLYTRLLALPLGGTATNTKIFSAHAQSVQTGMGKASQSTNGVRKLIIIPDGVLSYIPFDILLTQPAHTLNFRKLPYLMHDYQVSYAYSATLLWNVLSDKHTNKAAQYIAFAPAYESTADSLNPTQLAVMRDQLTPLYRNQAEANSIAQYFPGVSLTGKEAVEANFKNQAGQYNIIHLATHAFIDDEDPMRSRLVFTSQTDSLEDSYLYAHELYGMQLPADLVVLSACHTGFGKLAKGEGIMSLARAFAYAGCNSMVMNRWAAHDTYTAQLMHDFYDFLSQGYAKDEALRQAKMKFLQEAPEQALHPFYWGGFGVIGDTSAIVTSSIWGEEIQYVGMGMLVAMLISTLLFAKYRKKAKKSMLD